MMEEFDITKYRSGYSIGVGGVVLCGDKVLLVQSAFGSRRGEWSIPGGFVEPEETIDVAIKREIREEAKVQAEIQGLIATRNRVSENENSAYFIFLLHADSEDAHPDGTEVEKAQYFTISEALALPSLNALSRLIITKVLKKEFNLLTFEAHPTIFSKEYVFYL